jgi:6-phosphogluconolactonase (cycloisomerase 2 family)
VIPSLADEDRIGSLAASAEPFGGSVNYTFTHNDTANMQVGVFNASGELIRRLMPTASLRADTGVRTGALRWTITWDGNTDAGASAPTGASYTVRFASGIGMSLAQTVTSAGAQVGDPRDVDVDTDGNVYVAQRSTGSIIKYSGLNGEIIWNKTLPGLGLGQLNFPQGIAVDAAKDDLYVMDEDPDSIYCFRLQKFSAISGTFKNDSMPLIYAVGTVNAMPLEGGLAFQNRGGTRIVYMAQSCYDAGANPQRQGRVLGWNVTNGLDPLFASRNNPLFNHDRLRTFRSTNINASDQVADVSMNRADTSDVFFAFPRRGANSEGLSAWKSRAEFDANVNGSNNGQTGQFQSNATNRARSVAFNPDNGRVYSTNELLNTIQVWTPNSNNNMTGALHSTFNDALMAKPWGIAVSPKDSTIWTIANATGTLWQFEDDGAGNLVNLAQYPPPEGALSNPTDIALDASGRLYVVNSGGSNIIIYNLDGTLDTNFGTPGTGAAGTFNAPFGIAVDSEGYIFVTDVAAEPDGVTALDDDRIQVFYPRDHADSPLLFYRLGWQGGGGTRRGFRGIHISEYHDTLLLAVTGRWQSNAAGNRNLWRFRINGDKSLTQLSSFDIGDLTNAGRDVTIDREGRIYLVTNYRENDGSKSALIANKEVRIYNYAGNALTTSFTLTKSGAANGVAVTPFGEILVANAVDHQNTALGLDAFEFYHITGSTNDTQSRWPRPAMGVGDLSRPTAMAYGRGTGVEGTDYLWVIDEGNVALRKFNIKYDAASSNNTWVDVDLIQSTKSAAVGESPVITAAVLAGANVRTIGTSQYARAGGPCTVTITFSKVMDTTTAPWNTPTVKLVSSVNAEEIAAAQATYRSNVLTCTVASLPGLLADGRVRITVEGARDIYGLALNPNPTVNDTFSFWLDVTPPGSVHVTQPSSPTSDPMINVSGTASDNIKLYRIWVYNDSAASGGTRFDTATAQSDVYTSFLSWNVTGLKLRTAPSNNYVYALAEDAAGNLSDSSDGPTPNFDGEKRLVVRQDLQSGSARLTPDPEAGFLFGTHQRFVVKYTASQALSDDSITFTVPPGWTAPQNGNATLSGFTLFGDSSGFTGLALVADGLDTARIGFATAANGAWFELIYGDSTVSENGRTFLNDGTIVSLPVVKLGQNDFAMFLLDNGDTAFPIVGASPPPDLSLLVVASAITCDSENISTANLEVFSGQGDVRLQQLTFRNPNPLASGKDVRITSVTLTLQDTYGNPRNWNTIFAKVNAGADLGANIASYASQTSMPASPSLPLHLVLGNLTAPTGGSPVDLYITGQIIATARNTDSFRVVISAGSAIAAKVEIDGSNAPVTVVKRDGFSEFPINSSRIRNVSLGMTDTLAIGRIASADRIASEGQTIVPMRLRFSVPQDLTNPVFVEKLHLRVEGPSGGRIPNTVISQIRLVNDATDAVYLSKTAIESSGDSIVLDIPFTSPTPLKIGGVTAETVTVRVLVTVASTVTHNDTFRLSLAGIDTSRWIKPYEHPTNQVTPNRLIDKVYLLNPADTPLRSGLVTVQKVARVFAMPMRITDLSGTALDTLVQGAPFQVHLGLSAEAGRAGAVVRSSDTDITFRRANGTVDISSEFLILSRTHMTDSDLAAGARDTIIYEVVQTSPYSGSGETLVVNNRLSAETMPWLIDFNSKDDVTKLRIFALGDTPGARDTASARIDPAQVLIERLALANAEFLPGSTGNRIMSLRLTDVGSADTVTAVTVVLTSSTACTMIKTAWIAIDGNKNGVFDTGVDPVFGDQYKDFKACETTVFTGTRAMAGAGDTLGLFLIVNFETAPILDSTLITVRLPINSIGLQGKDSIPQKAFDPVGWLRTKVVATRLDVTPKVTSVLVDAALWMRMATSTPWPRAATLPGSRFRLRSRTPRRRPRTVRRGGPRRRLPARTRPPCLRRSTTIPASPAISSRAWRR